MAWGEEEVDWPREVEGAASPSQLWEGVLAPREASLPPREASLRARASLRLEEERRRLLEPPGEPGEDILVRV